MCARSQLFSSFHDFNFCLTIMVYNVSKSILSNFCNILKQALIQYLEIITPFSNHRGSQKKIMGRRVAIVAIYVV